MMINQLMRADPHVPDTIYDNFEFIDDISGKKLDRDKAIEARRLEMKFFRKFEFMRRSQNGGLRRMGAK